MMGNICKKATKRIAGKSFVINLDSLADLNTGIYFVQVVISERTYTISFLKNSPVMQTPPLSLLELNQHLKEVIKTNTRKHYWIFGEISELKVNYSGHCYLELIQKDSTGDQIVARSRATIWAQAFRMIKPYFETTTGQPLAEGLGILVRVSVEFHEACSPTVYVGSISVMFRLIP